MNHWLPCWARITHGQKINCYELLPQGRVGTFPSSFQKQPWNAERWNNARACHERQSDKQTPGSVCHSMWQSQWKNNTRCSFSEIPWKRHLKGEELLPRHRSLLMLCSWMQWEHRLKSQTSGASACLSEGTGRSLSTPPKLQARGSDQEEHHSWNKGMLDTFWPSWHCSRHYTDQQTRLSKN